MAQANSKRSGSYRARVWRLGTGVAVSLAMFTAGEVLAVDQSFYSFRDTRPNVPAGQDVGAITAPATSTIADSLSSTEQSTSTPPVVGIAI